MKYSVKTLSLLSILATLVIIPSIIQPASAVELVVNRSFENGTHGWNFAGSSSVSTDFSYSGSHSGKLSYPSSHIDQDTALLAVSDFVHFRFRTYTQVYQHDPSGLVVTINWDKASSGSGQTHFYLKPQETWIQKTILKSELLAKSPLAFRITKISFILNQPTSVYIDTISLTDDNTTPHVDTPSNLSFESGSTGWEFTGSVSVVTGHAHQGTKSVQSDGRDAGLYQHFNVAEVESDDYNTVKIWTDEGPGIWLYVRTYDMTSPPTVTNIYTYSYMCSVADDNVWSQCSLDRKSVV